MNEVIFSHGKSVCRTLGFAVKDQRIADEALPPIDVATDFCNAHQLHALYASALALRHAVGEDYQPLMANGLALAAKQIKIDITEQMLSRLFTEHGIRHIVLKGSHTRSFYPRALSRTSADIDWQIDPADSDLADTLLLQNGWTLCSASDDERCYEKAPRARLELHLAPEGFQQAQQDVMERLLGDIAVAEGLRFHLCDSAAYVYAVFHLYKHFVLAGAGVRMFLDVFAITKNGKLDRAYIDERLTALGCIGFEERVRQINAVLFDGGDTTAKLDALIRFVFACGAYGDKAAQLALEPLNAAVASRSRFKRALSHYCLDLPSMKTRYPCLERMVWLYPFCVVHRVGYGLRHRRAILRRALDTQQKNRQYHDSLERILLLANVL